MKYHGEVYDSGDLMLTIEGEHGYVPLVTVKLDRIGFGCEFYIDPDQARELTRHLIAAASTAELPLTSPQDGDRS